MAACRTSWKPSARKSSNRVSGGDGRGGEATGGAIASSRRSSGLQWPSASKCRPNARSMRSGVAMGSGLSGAESRAGGDAPAGAGVTRGSAGDSACESHGDRAVSCGIRSAAIARATSAAPGGRCESGARAALSAAAPGSVQIAGQRCASAVTRESRPGVPMAPLGGCQRCGSVTMRVWRPGPGTTSSWSYAPWYRVPSLSVLTRVILPTSGRRRPPRAAMRVARSWNRCWACARSHRPAASVASVHTRSQSASDSSRDRW